VGKNREGNWWRKMSVKSGRAVLNGGSSVSMLVSCNRLIKGLMSSCTPKMSWCCPFVSAVLVRAKILKPSLGVIENVEVT